MPKSKNVLLVTTTPRAIDRHLPETAQQPSSHWLISPVQLLPLADIAKFKPVGEFIVLLDERRPLPFELEDSLLELLADRVIYWIWHNESDVIQLPHDRVFEQREHSKTGTVAGLFFHWHNATSPEEKTDILLNHFRMSRRQAIEMYKRTYLNEYTAEQLIATGQRYLENRELNHTEKQLLELYPKIGEKLAAFAEETMPQRVHFLRLSLAQFLYDKPIQQD